ncbi:hypothetical protein PENTCL1PPCAC_29294 [Pristionchus entomophagus]|uniref:Post-SET domain-containing protein n=1 Tax=Pristionchus entomophagus TaxID=358040 RepID=A0AAV5ULP5_9BILA|nr:hypothetical protein PENTCL1PPCAC_29294 [Pristionchus entomophagus]
MDVVRSWCALLIAMTLVSGDCYNAEYGLTGLGDDEDSCYVLLEKRKVWAGYIDQEVEERLNGTELIPCYEVQEMFKRQKAPFACNCTGMICNGRALMEARHFIGLTEDKAPNDHIWKK